LPEWKENEDYYLGLFLVGAYQEVMGSYHNLFGVPNEAQVIVEGADSFRIAKVVPGSRIRDMVSFAHYNLSTLHRQFETMVQKRIGDGLLDASAGNRIMEQYKVASEWNTYLD
jgi:arginine decarboxylase